MKEAVFVLPLGDNDGQPIDYLHARLEKELGETWGGFSAFDGLGYWLSPAGVLYREAVRRYHIAMDSDGAAGAYAEHLLDDIARRYGRLAGQQSVYVVFANGRVGLIPIQTKAKPAASLGVLLEDENAG